MSKSLVLTLLLSTFLLQACSNSRPALPIPAPIDNKVDLQNVWRTYVDSGFGESSERFSIVAEGNSLYFVTNKGTVYELDDEKGKRTRSVKTDYRVSSGVTRNDDILYFGTYDAKLVAVSLSAGSVLWEKNLTSEILSEAFYDNGKIAVQTGDGWLSLLDAKSGETLWRVKEDLPSLTVRGTSSPVISGDIVLAGFASGRLKAFSVDSGDLLWSYEVGKPEGRYEIERLSDIDGRLVVKNGIVYSVAYNGTLAALSVETGRPVWQRSISSSVGVAVSDQLLIAVDMKSKVIALNARNGGEVWQNSELLERDLITPEFFRDYVAVMDRGGYVHLLDLNSGELAGRAVPGNKSPPGSRMATTDQKIFILTPNSNVTALSY